jgi:hypothetical protein
MLKLEYCSVVMPIESRYTQDVPGLYIAVHAVRRGCGTAFPGGERDVTQPSYNHRDERLGDWIVTYPTEERAELPSMPIKGVTLSGIVIPGRSPKVVIAAEYQGQTYTTREKEFPFNLLFIDPNNPDTAKALEAYHVKPPKEPGFYKVHAKVIPPRTRISGPSRLTGLSRPVKGGGYTSYSYYEGEFRISGAEKTWKQQRRSQS